MKDTTVERIFSAIMEAHFKATGNTSLLKIHRVVPRATMAIYRNISTTLLPTTAKTHYIFTMRDIMKILQWIIHGLDKLQNITSQQLIRLWYHECIRIFGDKLTNKEDRQLLCDLVVGNCKTFFDYTSATLTNNVIYGEIVVGSTYEELYDLERYTLTLKNYLHEYNSQNIKPIELYLFRDAIIHIAKLVRTLKQGGSHALLLGYSGSGRQSLTKLACYIAECELFELSISRYYGIEEWREELKKLLRTAGLQTKPVVFLFKETHLLNQVFMEDIENLIHNSNVPDLFSSEEIDAINQSLQSVSNTSLKSPQDATQLRTGEFMYTKFISQVRQNLHIVVCLDPSTNNFKSTLRMFPSLVTCTTVNWFEPWSAESLQAIARNQLSLSTLDNTLVDKVTNVFVNIHDIAIQVASQFQFETRRHVFFNSAKFLELLNVFVTLLTKKNVEIGGLIKRLDSGQEKLIAVSRMVSELQANLQLTMPILENTKEEVALLMINLSDKKREADATRNLVKEEEALAATEAAAAQSIAESAQAQLSQALPV